MSRTQAFILDLLERSFFTFLEAFAAAMLVPDLSLSALKSAGLAGAAAVFALVKGAAAGMVGQKGTAAALPKPDEPYEPPPEPEPGPTVGPVRAYVAPPPEVWQPRGGRDED